MARNESQTETVRNVRMAGLAFVTATALLFVFNSGQLRSAVRDWPPHPVSDRIVLAADAWHDLMTRLGVAGLPEAIRTRFEDLHGARW